VVMRAEADEWAAAGGDGWRPFDLVGNRLCLDFINTQVREKGRHVDQLVDFRAFVAWLRQTGALDEGMTGDVAARWEGTPEGEDALERARAFRATIRATVDGIVAGRAVPRATLDRINDLLRERAGYVQVAHGPDGFERRFHAPVARPIQLLAPLAEDVGDLLCDGDLALVKRCESPSCVRYFYDTTKNHTRRWCSMGACGNRAKAADHRRRVATRANPAGGGAR